RKKSPKTPDTNLRVTLVMTCGGVPAVAKGELVSPRLAVPTNPRVANVFVTRLSKVCRKKATTLVVKLVLKDGCDGSVPAGSNGELVRISVMLVVTAKPKKLLEAEMMRPG